MVTDTPQNKGEEDPAMEGSRQEGGIPLGEGDSFLCGGGGGFPRADDDLDEVDGVVVQGVMVESVATPAEMVDGPFPPDMCPDPEDRGSCRKQSKLFVLDPEDAGLAEDAQFHYLGIEVVTEKYHSHTLDQYLYRHLVVKIDEDMPGCELALKVGDEILMANSQVVVDDTHEAMLHTFSQLLPVDEEKLMLKMIVRRCTCHEFREPCIRPQDGATCCPNAECCQYLQISAMMDIELEEEADGVFHAKLVRVEALESQSISGDTIAQVQQIGPVIKYNIKMQDMDYTWKVDCGAVRIVTYMESNNNDFVFTVLTYRVNYPNSSNNTNAIEIRFDDGSNHMRHLVLKDDNSVQSQVLPKESQDPAKPELWPALWINHQSSCQRKLEAVNRRGFYLVVSMAHNGTNHVHADGTSGRTRVDTSSHGNSLSDSSNSSHSTRTSNSSCDVGEEEYLCPDMYVQEVSDQSFVPDGGRFQLLKIDEDDQIEMSNHIPVFSLNRQFGVVDDCLSEHAPISTNDTSDPPRTSGDASQENDSSQDKKPTEITSHESAVPFSTNPSPDGMVDIDLNSPTRCNTSSGKSGNNYSGVSIEEPPKWVKWTNPIQCCFRQQTD